jgi:hypothetical protein
MVAGDGEDRSDADERHVEGQEPWAPAADARRRGERRPDRAGSHDAVS